MNFDYCNGLVYIIRDGDTLYSLSRRYNVPLALILRANPYVDIYNLQIGDELCIPVDSTELPEEGPGPVEPPTPSLPGGNQPAAPGPGPLPLPTPSLPGGNQPAAPGPGPMPLPTPSLPGGNQPAAPGPGPLPLPTPTLPGPGMPCSNCHYQVIAYVIRDNETLQNLLDYFNITLDDLIRFNNLNGIVLRPGMTIQIPKFTDD